MVEVLVKKPASQDAVIAAFDEFGRRIGAKIDANTAAIGELRVATKANTEAIAELQVATRENTAAIQVNSEKIAMVDAKVETLRGEVVDLRHVVEDNHLQMNRKLNLILARLGVADGE